MHILIHDYCLMCLVRVIFVSIEATDDNLNQSSNSDNSNKSNILLHIITFLISEKFAIQ